MILEFDAMWCWTVRIIFCACILAPICVVCGGDAVPFPDALNAAAISVSRLDRIQDDALLVGNGDINALVYSSQTELRMMLTKNDVRDAPPITYNIAIPAVPVFPGDQVTWFSSDKERSLLARSIDRLKWNGNNSSVIMSVARARLSMPGSADFMRSTFHDRLKPNGTLGINRTGTGINRNGHYTEQFAATMAVSELLLQSVEGIIRVFPAWPEGMDARYADLRAQGGFLVTAEQRSGEIVRVEITSTVGGELRL